MAMTDNLFHAIALAAALLPVQVPASAQYRDLTPQEIVEKDPKSFIYEGKYIFSPAPIWPCVIEKADVIDESMLRVTYEAYIVSDTTSGHQYRDRMIVLIGDEWYNSYGDELWKRNIQITFPEGDPRRDPYEATEGYEQVITKSIYRHIPERKITNRCQIPETSRVYAYEEPQPEFRWAIGRERKEICGYTCYNAETHYAGRDWTVWFTPEIPVDCGLWKFSGLPGLILEASDSRKEYIFTAGGIEQKTEPIYVYRTSLKTVSRESFRRLERNLHEDPILYSDGPDGYRLWIDKKRGLTSHEVFTAGHFAYPYNPIELE